ncbi:SF3a splicing factor complex subunit [Vermiconidia calcicola]|uniref:SF3a splicing factor complex subunit n=1 Tax=Vermiconidia calcicola TaxID=1690605 RepID=A0ACC3N813_9PEZI|nr:SF3a splicing factor complex subunit [Vermiconidia calcicola]
MAVANGATPAANGTINILDEVSTKAPAGTVLPPKTVREVIEKTAGYVVRNGAGFEDRVRQSQGQQGRMGFINPEDEYHAYYRWRVSEITAGRGTSIAAGRKEGEVSFQGREERKGPEKPEEFKFSARMPNISAQDLEIVKLTALFVAKNGRSWMTQLSQREAGNYQFDFLRPQHSLYQFFSRLVDQYTDLLTGDSVDEGRPQKKRMTELEANTTNRFRMLERAKKRAEWVKHQEAQKAAQEEKDEKEKIAYAQIDWHDFVVVETVVFDEEDEHAELPAPTTLNDVQSRSLEQKANWGNDSSRRIEEAMPTFDDYEQFYDQAPPMPAAQQQKPPQPPPQPAYQPPPPEQSDKATLAADRARARAAQTTTPAVKIRHDYIPAAQARKAQSANTSLCPRCNQAIPNAEFEQHIKIEMLHPDWRDQYKVNQQRSATTNLSTADVAANLKRLASQRGDLFDPVTGEALGVSEEERERRRKVERRAYDGVSGVPNQAALGMMGSAGEQGQQGQGGDRTMDVQEQIRLIHERAARNG